jgi:hypothetical protein
VAEKEQPCRISRFLSRSKFPNRAGIAQCEEDVAALFPVVLRTIEKDEALNERRRLLLEK